MNTLCMQKEHIINGSGSRGDSRNVDNVMNITMNCLFITSETSETISIRFCCAGSKLGRSEL